MTLGNRVNFFLLIIIFFPDRKKKKIAGCGRGVEGRKANNELDRILDEKENDKEMCRLRHYVTRQGRRKCIQMSKRASYIGREYNPDSLDRAIKEQIIKLRSGLGSGFG